MHAQRDLSVLKRLPHEFEGSSYSIIWDRLGESISAVQMRGTSRFLQESKHCHFRPGQGYVGRIFMEGDKKDLELLPDVMTVDPRCFLRKHAALITGICSILFMPQKDGTLLEVGFDSTELALSFVQTVKRSKRSTPDIFTDVRSMVTPSVPQDLPLATLCTREPSPDLSWERSLPDLRAVLVCGGCRTRSPSPYPGLPVDSTQVPDLPSVGSLGHPLSCAPACKYVWRSRGCKEGFACTRCHICRYARAGERRFKEEQAALINSGKDVDVAKFAANVRSKLMAVEDQANDEKPRSYRRRGKSNASTASPNSSDTAMSRTGSGASSESRSSTKNHPGSGAAPEPRRLAVPPGLIGPRVSAA